MFIEQPPRLFRWLYPHALWRINPDKKIVYLTFDDGPIPEATPFILDTLDRFEVKATFFMVGDNAVKYPHLLDEVRRRGHQIGNHTFNHLSGFRHRPWSYLANIKKANDIFHTNLFRPRSKKLARQALGLPDDKRLVLFSSHMLSDERKGFHYLGEAIARLKRNA